MVMTNSKQSVSSGTYKLLFPYTNEILCQIEVLSTTTQQKLREFWNGVLFGNSVTEREGEMKCIQVLLNVNENDINVRKLSIIIVFVTIALLWWREYVRNKKAQGDLIPRHKGRIVFAELNEEEVQARQGFDISR